MLYAAELGKLGARIEVNSQVTAQIEGPAPLRGGQVTARDLRCGVALVLAGLAAKGRTVVEQARHIQRGYELLAKRLVSLGASIEEEL